MEKKSLEMGEGALSNAGQVHPLLTQKNILNIPIGISCSHCLSLFLFCPHHSQMSVNLGNDF